MAVGKYAVDTAVSVARSKAEIEEVIERYGGSSFAFATDQSSQSAMVGFRMHARSVRFVLPLPRRDSEEFTLTPSRKWQRDEKEAYTSWERACRQRWRALYLAIKAKLEAVEVGISVFDDEFLANIVLANDFTIGDQLRDHIDAAIDGTGPLALMAPRR